MGKSEDYTVNVKYLPRHSSSIFPASSQVIDLLRVSVVHQGHPAGTEPALELLAKLHELRLKARFCVLRL
jgi:hypothetical protein